MKVLFSWGLACLFPYLALSQPSLQLESIQKSSDPRLENHALVILKVDTTWNKGTGFQLLIDKDWSDNSSGSMGDATIEYYLMDTYSWNALQETYMIYQGCDYFIPKDASGVDGTKAVFAGKQDSVWIEGGRGYQYGVVEMTDETYGEIAPEPAPGYGPRDYQGCSYDGFDFDNGFIYTFTVTPDNVTREAQSVMGAPDLTISKLSLPGSSCHLGTEETISAEIYNRGKGDVQGFIASYQVNNGKVIEENFDSVLSIGEKVSINFSQKVDFSIPGEKYNIKVSVRLKEDAPIEESNLTNNERTSYLENKEPLYMPYISNFMQEAYRDHQWYSLSGGIDQEEWLFTRGEWSAQSDNVPLVSPCFFMQKGIYRFTYTYRAGLDVGIVQHGCSYGILMGMAEDSPYTFDTLYQREEEFTQNHYLTHSFVFEIERDDHYTFAFQTFLLPTFFLQSVKIEKVPDYDLAVTAIYPSIPHRIPQDQILPSFKVRTQVANHGLNDLDYQVDYYLQGKKIHQSDTQTLESLSKHEFTATIQGMENLKPGDTALLMAVGRVLGKKDSLGFNDTAYNTFYITDTVMALDRISNISTQMFSLGVVGATDPVEAGNIFPIYRKDTLSSISIGFAAVSESMKLGLAVYRWNDETKTIGQCLFNIEVTRQRGSGWQTFPVPARSLDSGSYMVAFRQLGSASVNIYSDGLAGGCFAIFNSDTTIFNTQMGYLAIRPNLGTAEVVAQTDIMVSNISKPAPRGVFSKKEEISASITNNGSLGLKNIPVVCYVNKQKLETTIDTLAPFASTQASFEANMAQVGTYLISIEVSVPGDENPQNDTLSREVECIPVPDPYFMDFEACNDFATEGFFPEWVSLDMDNTTVCRIGDFEYPGSLKPCGFMAFNPSMTQPEMDIDAILPYEGKRFGACFSALGNIQNNDWLISPKLKMPENGASVEFYAKSFMDKYGLEVFNVLVSTTQSDPQSFAPIRKNIEVPATSWTHYSFDLSDYNGKEIHIAIQCVSHNAYVFMIDNIKVSKPGENPEPDPDPTHVEYNHPERINIYPNPGKNELRIEFPHPILQLEILNTLGQRVYNSTSISQELTGGTTIHTDSWKSGIYILRIHGYDGIHLYKWMKL